MAVSVRKLIKAYNDGEVNEINVVITRYYDVTTANNKTIAQVICYNEIIEVDERTAKELVKKLDKIGRQKAEEILRKYIEEKFGLSDPYMYYDSIGNPVVYLNNIVVVSKYVNYEWIVVTGSDTEHYVFTQPQINVYKI